MSSSGVRHFAVPFCGTGRFGRTGLPVLIVIVALLPGGCASLADYAADKAETAVMKKVNERLEAWGAVAAAKAAESPYYGKDIRTIATEAAAGYMAAADKGDWFATTGKEIASYGVWAVILFILGKLGIKVGLPPAKRALARLGGNGNATSDSGSPGP